MKYLKKLVPLFREIKYLIKGVPVVSYEASNRDLPTHWIEKYIRNKRFDIVQIGSNDGKTGDPIHGLIKRNKRWRVLLVEPVPFIFQRLVENYPDERRFTFENVAINDGRKQVFYSVKESVKDEIEGLPEWHDQLSSFDRNNIVKHLGGILEPYIEETEINGITLSGLFSKNKIRKLAMIHIDVEGYDWKVLSQLDLKKYHPTIVLFEHKHLKSDEVIEAIAFLGEEYWVYEFWGDTLAIRKDKISEEDREFLKEKVQN